MRDHYDFSQGVKGKHTRPMEELKLPIYLEPAVRVAIEQLATSTGKDVNDLVNTILKKDLELLKIVADS